MWQAIHNPRKSDPIKILFYDPFFFLLQVFEIGLSDGRKFLIPKVNQIPILRKDFMVDEYQIIEAKALGADIVLLIAACLTPQEILSFAKLAKSLGLSTLLEVHSQEELDGTLNPFLDVVGVNNRNLKDFTVSIDTSIALAKTIPSDFLKISESAISNPETIKLLKTEGYNGFLIGENFMRTENPGKAMMDFVKEL